MIVSFASWAIYVPIGWRHPFTRYWQPSLGKTTAIYSLPHPENEHQQIVIKFQLPILSNSCSDWLQTSIYQMLAAFTGKTTATWSLPHTENEHQWSANSFSSCILGNQGMARIFTFTTELLTAPRVRNTIYQRQNTDSKLIDIASYKAFKHISLVVENVILIGSYEETPKIGALYESMDGSAGRLADNQPNPDWLGVSHRTIPELMVRVDEQPGPQIWHRSSLDPDAEPK